MATGNFVFASLAGENGPKPSDAFAKPGPTEEGVAIAVVVVAAKAGTVGGLDANGGINHLHRAGDGSIIGPANAEPHEFKKARVDNITFVPNAAAVVHVQPEPLIRIEIVIDANVVTLGSLLTTEMAGGSDAPLLQIRLANVGTVHVQLRDLVDAAVAG